MPFPFDHLLSTASGVKGRYIAASRRAGALLTAGLLRVERLIYCQPRSDDLSIFGFPRSGEVSATASRWTLLYVWSQGIF